MPANHPVLEESTDLSDIARLNELIGAHVKQHIPGIELRFDEPDPANPPASPTLHLFMYLIHEDLSIRHSTRRDYNPVTGSFDTEAAYIRCLYLVTYWDSLNSGGADSLGAQPDSPTVLNLTDMLKALLCMRNHADFKEYMLRVIEPEALNSLGNFWQALGNKPRAIINFAVTLPVNIQHPNEVEVPMPPVQSFENQLVQFGEAGLTQLEAYLFDQLRQTLDAAEAELALKKIVIDIRRQPPAAEEPLDAINVEVRVVGVTFSTAKADIESCVTSWQGTSVPLVGQTYQIILAVSNLVAPGAA
ncbi:TPA: DUF4255 domain-containing protein [Serratia odorifera]|nr:DUF4255 domain-containing protein [Serratia odorifera]